MVYAESSKSPLGNECQAGVVVATIGEERTMTINSLSAARPIQEDWDWQFQGACRGKDPEMFFHPENERGPRRRNRENAAKAICATCPVLKMCRDHALANQEPYGIWGGLSEDDRALILSRKSIAQSECA